MDIPSTSQLETTIPKDNNEDGEQQDEENESEGSGSEREEEEHKLPFQSPSTNTAKRLRLSSPAAASPKNNNSRVPPNRVNTTTNNSGSPFSHANNKHANEPSTPSESSLSSCFRFECLCSPSASRTTNNKSAISLNRLPNSLLLHIFTFYGDLRKWSYNININRERSINFNHTFRVQITKKARIHMLTLVCSRWNRIIKQQRERFQFNDASIGIRPPVQISVTFDRRIGSSNKDTAAADNDTAAGRRRILEEEYQCFAKFRDEALRLVDKVLEIHATGLKSGSITGVGSLRPPTNLRDMMVYYIYGHHHDNNNNNNNNNDDDDFDEESRQTLLVEQPQITALRFCARNKTSLQESGLHGIHFSDAVCATLEKLDLQHLSLINDAWTEKQLPRLSRLTSLRISACDHITRPLQLHPNAMQNLTVLGLPGTTCASDAWINELVPQLPNLRKLDLSFCMHVKNPRLHTCTKLEQLSLSSNFLDDAWIDANIQHMPRLKMLCLDFNKNIMRPKLHLYCPLLQVLRMSGTSVTDAWANETLPLLKQLRQLHLGYCMHLSMPDQIYRCELLEYLDVSGTGVVDEWVARCIPRFSPRLSVLYMTSCHQLHQPQFPQHDDRKGLLFVCMTGCNPSVKEHINKTHNQASSKWLYI